MDDQFTEEYCKGKMEQIISRLGEALGSATSLYQYFEAIQQRNARIAELEVALNKLIESEPALDNDSQFCWYCKGNLYAEPSNHTDDCPWLKASNLLNEAHDGNNKN
jgi:hypothetical protein